jgi:hypothetical protein
MPERNTQLYIKIEGIMIKSNLLSNKILILSLNK